MFIAEPITRPEPPLRADATASRAILAARSSREAAPDVIETRLWLDEYDWLHALLRSDQNVSPTFRFPDLISACVSLVFVREDAPALIFDFLGTQLVLRSPSTPRRRESMWRDQYELLLAVQRSPANRHPHPKFQLDQLTTASVALCQQLPLAGQQVLRQARTNMAQRALRRGRSSST